MLNCLCESIALDEYDKLEMLLEQDQFELLTDDWEGNDLRLVYLMNDAVESFLVFKAARLTGFYKSDYEGTLVANLSQDGEGYVLVVRQGDSVVSVFFEDLTLEVHLYNYGETGHVWVSGYEYLRQLEYRIAIMNNKLEYLGADYCTETEMFLAPLAEFPPLNFCCYPAVPEKYLVPNFPYWMVSEEALIAMVQLAEAVSDRGLLRWLRIYRRWPAKAVAKHIAWLLHRVRHKAVVDHLTKMITDAAAQYPDRDFGGDEATCYAEIMAKAKARQDALLQQGIQADVFREEPFVYSRDSITYKCHVMLWKEKGGDRQVSVETYEK